MERKKLAISVIFGLYKGKNKTRSQLDDKDMLRPTGRRKCLAW